MIYDAATFLAGLFQPTESLSPDALPGDWRTDYEERAAIMEYCGGLPRDRAESEAMSDVRQQMEEKPENYCT